MIRRSKRIIAGALIFLFVGSLSVEVMADSIKDAQNQIGSLEQEKQEMEEQLKKLEEEKGNIVTYIEKLDKQLNTLTNKIEKVNTSIDETEKSLATAQEELTQAEQTQVNQYNTMKARIKYMYENGNAEYVEILTNSGSISDLLNRAEYINKISQYDENMYKNYEATKQTIAAKKSEIEANLQELSELNQKLELEKDGVNTLVSEKNRELKKYNTKISDTSTQIDNVANEIEKQEAIVEDLLEQERIRIEQERKAEEERKRKEEEERKKQEALQQQQAGATGNTATNSGSTGNNTSSNTNSSISNTSSGLRWPLQVAGTITSYFGPRTSPTAGASSYHKGIDLAAPTGTSIVSAGSGTVVTAAYNSGAGNYVMIYHGNSTYTVYMHCSSLKVTKGQEVKSGQVIATVGSTGISTGPHLHFGVSKNGSYVDPLKYVSR